MGKMSKLARYEMMRRYRNEGNGEEMRGEMRGEMRRGNYNEMRGEMQNRGEMRNRYEMQNEMRNEMQNNGGRYRMEYDSKREREDEMEDNYSMEQRRNQPRRRDGTFKPRSEMYSHYDEERKEEYEGKGNIIGFTDRNSGGKEKKMTPEKAQQWVHKMRSEDGTPGEHWSMEQVKHLMQQRGVQHDPAEVYAIMNALYSDYSKVFKKYGITSPEAILEMAVAWLEDADAVENKAMMYYECIVKH